MPTTPYNIEGFSLKSYLKKRRKRRKIKRYKRKLNRRYRKYKRQLRKLNKLKFYCLKHIQIYYKKANGDVYEISKVNALKLQLRKIIKKIPTIALRSNTNKKKFKEINKNIVTIRNIKNQLISLKTNIMKYKRYSNIGRLQQKVINNDCKKNNLFCITRHQSDNERAEYNGEKDVSVAMNSNNSYINNKIENHYIKKDIELKELKNDLMIKRNLNRKTKHDQFVNNVINNALTRALTKQP
jgi:hypothetical protein